MATLTVEYFKKNYASLKDIPDDDVASVLHRLKEDWIETTTTLENTSRDSLLKRSYPIVFVDAVKPAEVVPQQQQQQQQGNCAPDHGDPHSDIAKLVPLMFEVENIPKLSDCFVGGATLALGDSESGEELNILGKEEEKKEDKNDNESATDGRKIQAQEPNKSSPASETTEDAQKRKTLGDAAGERESKRARPKLWTATLKPISVCPLVNQFHREMNWYQGEAKSKLFVRESSDHKLTIIEFKNNGEAPEALVKVQSEDYVKRHKAPKGTWFLYDSVGGTGSAENMIPFQKQHVGVPCVIFSSPKKNNYRAGIRDMQGGILWYLWMPAWEWREIDSVMNELFEEWGGKPRSVHRREEFREFISGLFTLWGGIPRRFNKYTQEFRDNGTASALSRSKVDFEDEMKSLAPALINNKAVIGNNLGDLDLPVGKSEQEGPSKKMNPPSWLVFPCPLEFNSERTAFQECVYRFCSQRAELEFFKCVEEQSSDVVRNFCKDVFRIRTAYGVAFERFAHFVLTRTEDNAFRWRKYGKNEKIEVKLPKCKSVEINMKNSLTDFEDAVRNCITHNKPHVIDPKSDQQDAIDMFVVIKLQNDWYVLAMQDTISKTHSFHPVKILEYKIAAQEGLQKAGVNAVDDFFRHVVVVPHEKSNGIFSLLPAKHNKKRYWCPSEETADSSTNTSKAVKVHNDVIKPAENKCLDLGLDTDFTGWNKTKAIAACSKRKVKNYTNLQDGPLMRVGAGAKLLEDAEKEVQSWTWVLDGFFE